MGVRVAVSRSLENTLVGRHVLSAEEFSPAEVSLVLNTARVFEQDATGGREFSTLLQGKTLTTAFFEPSTRTRLSFEAAMLRLGGQISSIQYGRSSSSEKGESLQDMGRILSGYADIVAVRHPGNGSVAAFASTATVPVINAGDGANQHPTQALLDLYTIFLEKSRLDGLTIGFIGDLKYSRTVHSLISLLQHHDVSLRFISHPLLALPDSIKGSLAEGGQSFQESRELGRVLPELDVLYVTRVQKERFGDPPEYEQANRNYQLNRDTLQHSKPDLILLHPLPRLQEIHPELDSDPRAKYFRQAQNGVYVRMALLALLLGQFPVNQVWAIA
jgi:aspartate carbamoyltransferase catalytic subunit